MEINNLRYQFPIFWKLEQSQDIKTVDGIYNIASGELMFLSEEYNTVQSQFIL